MKDQAVVANDHNLKVRKSPQRSVSYVNDSAAKNARTNFAKSKSELRFEDVDVIGSEDLYKAQNISIHDVINITTPRPKRKVLPKPPVRRPSRRSGGRFSRYTLPGQKTGPKKKPIISTHSEYDLEKQKSFERTTKTSNVSCLCCTLNPSCVGIVGTLILIAMAIALLCIPTDGALRDTVPIYIPEKEAFFAQFNDSLYNYTFRVLKHKRNYLRLVLMNQPTTERTYISISQKIGYFDDYLINSPGISRLMFEQLPLESFYYRNGNSSRYLRHVKSPNVHESRVYTHDMCTINVNTLGTALAKEYLVQFNEYFGFGDVSIPDNFENYFGEMRLDPVMFNRWLVLLPTSDKYLPK